MLTECLLRGEQYLADPRIPKIVGISAGNSYYGGACIKTTLNYFGQNNNKVYPFVAEKLILHNFAAIGYTQSKAEAKVRRVTNRLYRYIDLAVKELNNCNDNKTQFETIKWSIGSNSIESDNVYLNTYEMLIDAHLNDKQFEYDIDHATQQALSFMLESYRSGTVQTINDVNYDHGRQFLLKEFAYLLVSPHLLDCEKTVYIYHKEWPIFENILNGKYGSIDEKQFKNVAFCPKQVYNCQQQSLPKQV